MQHRVPRQESLQEMRPDARIKMKEEVLPLTRLHRLDSEFRMTHGDVHNALAQLFQYIKWVFLLLLEHFWGCGLCSF